MQPLHVLHVHSGNLYGGVETILLSLAHQRDGLIDHQFALCFEGQLSRCLVSLARPVHTLGSVRLSRPWSVVRARAQLEPLLQSGRFDIIVCHSLWSMAAFGATVHRAGIPLVLWLHARPAGRGWLERMARRTTPDLVVCCSRFTQDGLPMLYPSAPSRVVYAPLEFVGSAPDEPREDVRRDVRSALGIPEDAVVIIQASRMESWKGQHVLVEALALLKDIPQWHCWLVGGAQRDTERSLMQSLESDLKRQGLADRVQLLGHRSDVARLLLAADVYCQPNTGPDPFPVAFIEALNAGLPVVTSAIGGAPEAIHSGCGVLLPPGDAQALSRALRTLVADRALRQQLAAGGPGRAKELCDPSQQGHALALTFSGVVRRTTTT